MREFFSLAIVGLAITLGISVADHCFSQAKINQVETLPSPVVEQQSNINDLELSTIPDAESIEPVVSLLLNNNLPRKEEDNQPINLEISQTDEEKRFQEIIQYAIAHNLSNASMGEIMQGISEQFLGAQYQEGLLDQSEPEKLVVSLKNFDCVLFVETVLAIARNITLQDYQYQTFTNNIVDQRYWNGNLNGYCSRLHYFSEWINDNHRRGTIENITPYLGGISLNKTLNFMSTHRSRYPRIVNNEANYRCILEMEANLDDLTINYIPHNQIRNTYPQLQPGDIIGIATNIAGLDVTHTGLAYRTSEGQIGLIHASPIGKVTIAQDLEKYVGNVKNAIGILVARPLDPRQQQISPAF